MYGRKYISPPKVNDTAESTSHHRKYTVVQEKEEAVIMVILIFGILCTVLMEEDSMADIFCDRKA
ncbi:hypothetical protein GQX74_008596 [Glossina fuscipes]|nr:hypothetical protein GQX74_008596 [Glossina fuscipes]